MTPTLHAQQIATVPNPSVWEATRVSLDIANAPLPIVLRRIAQQAGLIPVFNDILLKSSSSITLHMKDVPTAQAFEQALSGTGLVAHVLPSRQVVIVRVPYTVSSEGQIVGRVTEGKTRRPLPGVTIELDGKGRVVVTGEDGTYHIPNVSTGTHTVTAKLLGYTKNVRTVIVPDNGEVSTDIALDVSAVPLGQVVVTGTVIPTELKAVPNAITVITAKQIEERGITRIDQLFRGEVPGVFTMNVGTNTPLDEVTMFSRGATALDPNWSALQPGFFANNGALTNRIKTYVDGVELADAKYMSQIDPKNIERIEILTGPQASTIYGSNAINGVMQIFTKRSASVTPQLTLNLLSGWVENNFSNAHAPQHDYSAQINGASGGISYNIGGSWNYTAPWSPAKQTTRTGDFIGTRLTFPTAVGQIVADFTLKRTVTQNKDRGTTFQSITGYSETGWYNPVFLTAARSVPTTRILTGQTLGATFNYAPFSWWSHELNIGRDASDVETRRTEPGYLSRSDTSLLFDQTHSDRRSVRYATTVRAPMTSVMYTTLTLGADSWQDMNNYWRATNAQTLSGGLGDTFGGARLPGHNTGAFLQTQLAWLERMFFTYGLRLEWNPLFGSEAEPNYAPRYGAAYTQDFGAMTAKIRASYGRSTRPPRFGFMKTSQHIADPNWAGPGSLLEQEYGNFVTVFANPELAPEHQQGGEGGLEVYWGTHGSIVITRYNQTVDGLISQPVVDSVRSLIPYPTSWSDTPLDANGYGYIYQNQFLNVGSIRNQGWELQNTANIGPLTTHATYSWTKSRTIGVNPKYRAFFMNQQQYQPGATFRYLPEHTWSFTTTYANAATTIVFTLNGLGQAQGENNAFYYRNLYSGIRLPSNRQNLNGDYGYVSMNRGYVVSDLNVSRHLSRRTEALLQVQNLTDNYANDLGGRFASIGRQTKLGFRLKL